MKVPSGWERAGTVGVDSGTLMIGDPCYLDGGFDYSEWCDSMYWDGSGIHPGPSDFAKPGEGLTFAASTAYGDGSYPVYVKRGENARIVAMMVITDPEEDF